MRHAENRRNLAPVTLRYSPSDCDSLSLRRDPASTPIDDLGGSNIVGLLVYRQYGHGNVPLLACLVGTLGTRLAAASSCDMVLTGTLFWYTM